MPKREEKCTEIYKCGENVKTKSQFAERKKRTKEMKMDDRIEITVQEGYVVLFMISHTSMALVYILSSK